jgi:hypothetical protein
MLPPSPVRVLAAITSSHIDDESAKRNLDTSIIRCRAAPDSCSLITPVSVAAVVTSATPDNTIRGPNCPAAIHECSKLTGG